MIKNKLLSIVPEIVQRRLESYSDVFDLFSTVRDARVLASLGPAGVRGLILKRGKQGIPTKMPARHAAHFDWTYPNDHAEMRELYRRAKENQWDGETYLPWEIDVDPMNPERPLVPYHFFKFELLDEYGVHLDRRERAELNFSMATWTLSQFLHGEQGALFAAAQVTEAVQFFNGKLYGATQVMDEARHVEVFHRYLDQKANKLYQINDNLFVIIDALMSDARWDMKFLGMQIMVEGLALGAFGTLYRMTREPLLRELLRMVIQDEARHVHYGVLALREHFRNHISEKERREREDWAFEVALLMRNRFMGWEVFEEWFEGRLTRRQWRHVINESPGMQMFRQVMFSRLVPNLREIDLLTDRIKPRYEEIGLMQYFDGRAADQLSGKEMLAELDAGRNEAPSSRDLPSYA